MTERASAATAGAPDHMEEEQDRLLIRRGAISLAYDPLEFWHDTTRVPLSPSEATLLALLMRRGRASWQTVNEVLRDGAPSQAIRDVLVYRIRRKFQAVGAGDPIETVRGWGLKLRIDRSPGAPSGVLIGGRTSAFALYP